MMNADASRILDVPTMHQTIEMCHIAVKYNKHNLQYCNKIDDQMLDIIYKSQIDCPRKDRFCFIYIEWRYTSSGIYCDMCYCWVCLYR